MTKPMHSALPGSRANLRHREPEPSVDKEVLTLKIEETYYNCKSTAGIRLYPAPDVAKGADGLDSDLDDEIPFR